MPLKPFDPASVCPKCGCDEAATAYRTKQGWYPPEGRPEIGLLDFYQVKLRRRDEQGAEWRTLEWLERTCAACGYSWEEAPLDACPNAPKEPEP